VKRILIVDDQSEIRDLITMTLEDEPFELREAGDGATALQIAESFKPDMVLLDVMMPGVSGIQVCEQLRSKSGSSKSPVILMLSALADVTSRDAGLKAGATDYLCKPFSPSELRHAVHRLL
jgi:DNA-binding response OmpR family regulator